MNLTIKKKKQAILTVWLTHYPMQTVCFGTNTPPSWGNQFKSKMVTRDAGWPLEGLAAVAKIVKKAKSKN